MLCQLDGKFLDVEVLGLLVKASTEKNASPSPPGQSPLANDSTANDFLSSSRESGAVAGEDYGQRQGGR